MEAGADLTTVIPLWFSSRIGYALFGALVYSLISNYAPSEGYAVFAFIFVPVAVILLAGSVALDMEMFGEAA